MDLQLPNWVSTAARPAVNAAKNTTIGALRLRHVLGQTPAEFVFINCTARSGSTLLSNILCNHPQICGFGETQTIYRSSADLSTLVAKVYWAKRQFHVRERFAFEKIVLNRLLPRPEVLNDATIFWIYLLRDPAAVLRSFMEFHSKSETQALNYYRNRLNRVQSDARHYAIQGHRAFFVTYEQLVAEPQPILDALSYFLNLNSGLASRYTRPRVHDMSAGDQSERIKAGQIFAEPRRYRVGLSSSALEQARAAHAECEVVLRRHCEFVTEQGRREAMLRAASLQ